MTKAGERRIDSGFGHLDLLLYWELRRWLFNFVLPPAALVGSMTAVPLLVPISLPPQPTAGGLLMGVGVWVIGANVFYSIAYLLENFFRVRHQVAWHGYGRSLTFFLLSTAAVALTARAGNSLAGWTN